MGVAGSKAGGTGHQIRSQTTALKCSRIPEYVDRRVWALKKLYKINDINEFPPQLYSAKDAEEDINDCRLGVQLRHSWKVVSSKRIEDLKKKDVRMYTLQKYHGYAAGDVTPRLLKLLPYSKLDASKDVAYYRKYRLPYFTIDKLTSVVRSRDGKITRHPGQTGTHVKYSYDRSDISKKGKIMKTGTKFDPKAFSLKTMSDGTVKRVIPCSAAPEMCVQGRQTFVSGNVGDVLKRAALLNSKDRKQKLKMLHSTHTRKIRSLNKKISAARTKEAKDRLVRQRAAAQFDYRVGVAKTEQANRIHVEPKRTASWVKKRAELGKAKQQTKQREKMIQREQTKKKTLEGEAIRRSRQMSGRSSKSSSSVVRR